jgi:hypothetical protein
VTAENAEPGIRKLIAGMKVSLDGKMEGPEGMADWVSAWSDDYGLTGPTPRIDACLLGGGMYPGYEGYWSAIRSEPGKPHWITGEPPDSGRDRMGRDSRSARRTTCSRAR